MAKLDKKSVINGYRDAYMQAHGTEPSIIEEKGGWFVINHEKPKVRLSSLLDMTHALCQRAEGKGDKGGEG